MRAVVVRNHGGPEVLEVAEVPVPEPGPGQVRIRVEAAAVNPVDLATRSGALTDAGLVPPRDVTGIGWDAAGFVDAVAPGLTDFVRGDHVIGLSDRLDVPLGAQADYVVLDAGAVARVPGAIPAAAAATLPFNGLTAVQALDLLGLVSGQTLLVTGAAGAVGGFAVQLAAMRGLRVAAAAGAEDRDLVHSLGAEWFVARDAGLDGVRSLVPGGVDGALDAAMAGVRALDAVRGGGSFVAVAAGAAPVPLRGTRVHNVWIRADGERLAGLATMAATRQLTLRVADTLPLDRVADAHARLAKGGLRGRLVLIP
jgi:NADPH2:quinone reductase